MEVIGAIIVTFAIYRVGESSRSMPPEPVPASQSGELRG
jgi:hypothetical protein